MFLESPNGNKVLSGKQQGTIVNNISYKDLKTIEIPLLRLEEQQAVVDEYEQELELYLESIKNAEDRWQSVVTRLQDNLLKVK